MEDRRDRMESRPVKLVVQGDVFLTPCRIPDSAKELKHRTLAKGEATGHAHVADSGVLYENDGVLYLRTGDKMASIIHEEHKPVTLPANSEFVVGIVKEWDEFEEEARNVRD